jgi:hypothetical protein
MLREAKVGDRTIRIEAFSGRKGIQVLRAIEHIADGVPLIQDRWATYTREYEDRHTEDLDRAFARSQYGPEPMMREDPVVEDGKALTDALGRPLVRREPVMDSEGRIVMGHDPLGHMTEEDWAASGNKLRRPRTPRVEEQIVAILPMALELAEEQIAKLLGLIAMSNSDIKRYGREGSLWEKAAELGDDLLDADLNELVELAVVAGESLRDEYQMKVRDRLGERMGAMLRLLGLDVGAGRESSETRSTTSPTSSTDSPTPTDGENDVPLTEPASVASEPSLTG